MLSLLKKLRTVLLLNAVLVLFFVWTSYQLADIFNSRPDGLFMVHWNFFGWSGINFAGGLVNGNFVSVGAPMIIFDFPFWLFFISTAVNMIYIVKLLKDQESKKK